MQKYPITATLIAVIIIVLASPVSRAQPNQQPLKFGKDKTFKIAQFTDIHWDNNIAASCEKTLDLMKTIINIEQPDLVVLTGDIVTVSPAREGWRRIGELLALYGKPWAVVLGNHDDETDMTRSEIFSYLAELPGFIGEVGTVSGVGNYIKPVLSSDEKASSSLLYFIDSHAYTDMEGVGYYDWIKFDQIQWYRQQSALFTAENNKVPLPALAFFHIPTREYNEVYNLSTSVGLKNEDVASAAINPGMTAAFIEAGDVMATFVGHDHVNNYIGIYNGLALAYGQKTGFNSYGDLPQGARIIQLFEGKRSFNTWIRTYDGESYHYNYPFGQSFKNDGFTFRKSMEINDAVQGLKFRYYEGSFKSVEDFQRLEPLKTGLIEAPEVNQIREKSNFGYVFEGFIHIPATGLYRFYTISDDGSTLWIDDEKLVDNDGLHGHKKVEAVTALEQGFHSVKICYFNGTGGQFLELGYSSIHQQEEKIPASWFFWSR